MAMYKELCMCKQQFFTKRKQSFINQLHNWFNCN